jgi:hypothetical protein
MYHVNLCNSGILITFLLLLSCTNGLQSQSHAFEKQTAWYELFANNEKDWLGVNLEDLNGKASITGDGTCEIIANEGRTMVIANQMFLDTRKDFEISARLKLEATSTAHRQSLFSFSWGFSFEDMYQFSLSLSPDGIVVVRKLTGNIEELIPPKKIEAYNTGSYNVITIRKLNNTYTYLINNKTIGTSPFIPLFGEGMVITVGGGLIAIIDHIELAYLQLPMQIKRLPRVILDPPFASDKKAKTEEQLYTVSGYAADEDGISTLKINGLEVDLNGGQFNQSIPLALGNNLIKIEAVDNTGQTKIEYIEIIREEPVEKLIVSQKRLALVIGNATYMHAAPLENTIKDAKTVAITLEEELDFEVRKFENLDYTGFINAVKDFSSRVHQYDVTMIFFAGHGIQVDGKNYMIPVDARLDNKSDVPFETIETEKILNILSQTDDENLNILVLDACRNNPFRGWTRGGADGLASVYPPSGTIIAYATSPGSYASDGTGENGLYTRELVKQLKKSQRIEDVFINTRIAVEEKSKGMQSPWELARLRGKYYLK